MLALSCSLIQLPDCLSNRRHHLDAKETFLHQAEGWFSLRGVTGKGTERWEEHKIFTTLLLPLFKILFWKDQNPFLSSLSTRQVSYWEKFIPRLEEEVDGMKRKLVSIKVQKDLEEAIRKLDLCLAKFNWNTAMWGHLTSTDWGFPIAQGNKHLLRNCSRLTAGILLIPTVTGVAFFPNSVRNSRHTQ